MSPNGDTITRKHRRAELGRRIVVGTHSHRNAYANLNPERFVVMRTRGTNGRLKDRGILEQDHVKMGIGLELGMSSPEDITAEFVQGRDCLESVPLALSGTLHKGEDGSTRHPFGALNEGGSNKSTAHICHSSDNKVI